MRVSVPLNGTENDKERTVKASGCRCDRNTSRHSNGRSFVHMSSVDGERIRAASVASQRAMRATWTERERERDALENQTQRILRHVSISL